MNFIKILKFVIIILVVLGVLILWVVESVLPYSPIKPYRYDVRVAPEFSQGYLPDANGLKYFPIEIKSYDSLLLKGYYLPSDLDKGTIIVLHGIGDCKEHAYSFCKFIIEHGCNAIVMDSRAHGQSMGDYCTFGAKEKYDIQKVVDYAIGSHKDTVIGIFGNSLGGAIALQALELDSRIKFGIIESTFNNLEYVTNEYLEDIIGFKIPALVNRTLRKSGKIASFDPFSINPSEACKKIQCPMFFAHGNKDEKIPIEFNLENFRNVPIENKEFHTVDGAGHNTVHLYGGKAYSEKLSLFINKQL